MYITFEKEVEHSESKQEAVSVSQKIWAGSTVADKMTTNTLSASVGIFQPLASHSAYG